MDIAASVRPNVFTIFNDLPAELRYMIWRFALPDDSPEVCIPWPLEEVPLRRDPDGEIPRRSRFLEPFLVDTDFPVTMHVCRESREVAISSIHLRYSPVAGCPVPFRAFRPELDTLYVSVCRPPSDNNVVPRWGQFPAARHLALDLHSLKDGSFLWILVGNPFLDVRSLTCVLPLSNAILDTAARFRPPVRRCRLREVVQPSNGAQSHIIYVDRGYDRRMTGMGRYLEEVQDHMGAEFADILEAADIPEEYLRRWNAEASRFDIDFSAKTFEEYRGGRWVDSSEHLVRFDWQSIIFPAQRKPVETFKTYRVTEAELWTPLRDPETFRVNDIQQDEVPI
ncbi:Nem1-Spo7 phosphatase regulatory subunit [Hypoxylon texense]